MSKAKCSTENEWDQQQEEEQRSVACRDSLTGQTFHRAPPPHKWQGRVTRDTLLSPGGGVLLSKLMVKIKMTISNH